MLPQDPVILLSYINTQLRDNYGNLEALTDGLGLSSEGLQDICDKLKAVGYVYDDTQNKFI